MNIFQKTCINEKLSLSNVYTLLWNSFANEKKRIHTKKNTRIGLCGEILLYYKKMMNVCCIKDKIGDSKKKAIKEKMILIGIIVKLQYRITARCDSLTIRFVLFLAFWRIWERPDCRTAAPTLNQEDLMRTLQNQAILL